MTKDTFQQIIFFIITSALIFMTGKQLIIINDITTFAELGIIMVFFVSLVLFLNYFLRLSSKLIGTFRF
ncbi:hypothetical protein [Polaribacter glomeratus]|uniref:Uncharacterized protein n=1 Tax=Polaribacter glomeratus TaxID=102 RepID=A0A2S7WUQ8_9FLAO|nr:hypothetical protein [Polaribacter glomeratus]PQJ81308.1 hypothetical protein BTO16_01375 [Polaribacter glomeratus]TXD64077.1 hypothetical protein ESX12_16605 [Polaribacter glomeratus]